MQTAFQDDPLAFQDTTLAFQIQAVGGLPPPPSGGLREFVHLSGLPALGSAPSPELGG